VVKLEAKICLLYELISLKLLNTIINKISNLDFFSNFSFAKYNNKSRLRKKSLVLIKDKEFLHKKTKTKSELPIIPLHLLIY
jgi:hypothetical protein